MALEIDPFPPDPGLLAIGIHIPSAITQQLAGLVPVLIQWTLIAMTG